MKVELTLALRPFAPREEIKAAEETAPVLVAAAAVWSACEMADQEDTTRHDRTGSLLGVVDRGRDKLAVFHHCRSDDEVVDGVNAIRRSLVNNPRPITVDSVGSHIRACCDLPASSRRSWIRLVNNEGLREIAFSIVMPYAKCECYVSAIGSDTCVIAVKAGQGVTPWCIVLRGGHADVAKE